MKFFTNKKIWQKIVIILLVLLFFQLFIPKQTHAIEADVLLEPVTNLFANLGDGIMNILQKTIMGMDASGVWIEENSEVWLKILIVVAEIVIATIAVIATIYSGGAALTIIFSSIGAVVKIAGVAAVAYFAVSVTHFGGKRILFTRVQIDTTNDI